MYKNYVFVIHLCPWVNCTMHPAPRTLYLVPHAPYPVPRTSHLVPRTSHPVSRTSYLVLCTSGSAPSTLYRHISGTSSFCWIIIQSVLHLVPCASHHVLRTLHHVPHTSHLIPHTMYHVPRTHARHAKKDTSNKFVGYLKHACIYKAELILFLCKIGARGVQPPPAPLMAGGFWPNRLPCYVHYFHLCMCPPSRPNKCTPYHVPCISYLVPRTSHLELRTMHLAPCPRIWHITPHISFIISLAKIPTVTTSLKTW
jgi:hypothetical protein